MIRFVVALATLFVPVHAAVDLSTYRGFTLGADVAATSKVAGLKPADLRIVHKLPVLMEELDWRPLHSYSAGPQNSDPVREALLRFYNGALFQIISTYDRQKVEGMSEVDMIAALSQTYGVASTPASVEIAFHSYYGETALVLARWEDAAYSYNLVRSGDQASYALIMSQKKLEALAEAAIVAAKQAEAMAAPQKALDLAAKQEGDAKLLLNKARAVNVPNFRP